MKLNDIYSKDINSQKVHVDLKKDNSGMIIRFTYYFYTLNSENKKNILKKESSVHSITREELDSRCFFCH